MSNEERFQKNLERFARFSKNDAELIQPPKEGPYSLCHNANGELNLKIEKDGEIDYLYSRESVQKEASEWFSNLKLDGVKILYVFGVGLGSYYEACKDWLQQDMMRFLIFLEDDKEIISYFFETELATEILHNKQVILQYVDDKENADIQGIDNLTTAFLFDAYQFTGLKYYKEKRSKIFSGLSQYFSHNIYSKQTRFGEFLTGSVAFFQNYYNNLKFLPESYLGNDLFGKFENIPAIICGGGPSLEKNIHLLKTLGDKALIIAGGTAINALNSHDVFPHFTAGIDPNPTQLLRILANNAYETPFFYRNRINTSALDVNSGEKLYVTGAGGYAIPKWVEKKLHINTEDFVDEGHNVINFSVSIAKALGCNPIILCGVDLAYTNNQSYVSGIKFHALHNYKQTFITKNSRDELIGFKDIYGNTTSTLWKWVNEASWYAYFNAQNPNKLLINATEGGIGFAGVNHMTLSDVANTYFQNTYDLESMIHAEIQNSRLPEEVNNQNVLKVMKVLRKDLGECEEILKKIIDESKLIVNNRFVVEKVPLEPSIKKIEALKEELKKNDYYTYLLGQFNDYYRYIVERRLQYFLYDLELDDEESKQMSKIESELDAYKFTRSVLQLNKKLLEEAIRIYPQKTLIKEKKQTRKPEKAMILEEKKVTYYPNHVVKTEQVIKNGLLDGPSLYYSPSGHLLSKSFFEKNLREGKSFFYYATGKLFAVKEFKQGLPDGLHEFYYEDGRVKSKIHYRQGKLDGEVLLYYPDNKLKRELHFKNGKRNGVERMWNKEGLLVIEANYLDDKPVGEANWWYDNGVLQQKVMHHDLAENYEIQRFTPDGKEIPKASTEGKDYFDQLIDLTNVIMASIQDIFEKTDKILPLLEGSDSQDVQERKQQLESLREEVKKLTEINQNIRDNFSGDAHNLEEPIWKSTALQSQIEGQLKGLIDVMKEEILSMQNLIQKMIEKVKSKL